MTPPEWSRLAAVVPAAGRGSRMGAAIAKQYLPLVGKTIIEHTLEALLALPQLPRIYVALAADDDQFQRLPLARDGRITTVIGGAERADSVAAALALLLADGFDWALVHDAARPCITAAEVATLVARARELGHGAILASRVRDTMKRAHDGSTQVAETVSRADLWHALTPQLFPARALAAAIAAAGAAGVAVTDEASAMEWRGQPVALVAGSRWNIKVTEPEDLTLAALWLSGAHLETR